MTISKPTVGATGWNAAVDGVIDAVNALGNSATLNVGTAAGTVAAGNDTRVAAAGTAAATRQSSPLASRITFGAYANTGGTAQLAALETALGVKIPRYVSYQAMATGGSSGWPSTEADWCKSTGHDLVIAWDIQSSGPTFANILAGGNNASLDAFFTAAKNYGAPVTLRMWWEMNDVTGPTKVGNASSTLFASSTVSARRTEWIAAWQYVYNRCKVTNGATNVKFFFCANGSDTGATTIEQLWPGTAYVDIVGLDTYNETTFASWTSFTAKIAPMMNRLAALAPDLPQGIGELGTVNTGGPGGTSKATWLQDMFASADWPNLAFIDWFSVNQTNDWRLDQTAASIAAAQTGIARTQGSYRSIPAPGPVGINGVESMNRAHLGSTATVTRGSLYVCNVTAATAVTVTNMIATPQTGPGTGVTLARMGIYIVTNPGTVSATWTLAASTASDTTMFASGFTDYKPALSTPYALVPGVAYGLALLVVGGTADPTFYGNGNSWGGFNGLSPTSVLALSGQTNLPSSFTGAAGPNVYVHIPYIAAYA